MEIKLYSKTIKAMVLVIGVIILSAILNKYFVSAQNIYPQGNFYENSENEGFTCNINNKRSKFSYSDKPIVRPVLKGEFGEVINKEINGYPAYGLTGKVVFNYNYAANSDPKPYMDGEDKNWNIKSSDEEIIDGFDMGAGVDCGTILILKSKDGINWEKAREPFRDFFDDYVPLKHEPILEISEDDVIDGMYYRVLVAYQMGKKIGSNKFVRNYLEEYKFYLCSEINHTVIKQMDGKIIENSHYASVEEGFTVERGGDNLKVSITRNDDYNAGLKGKYSVIREKGVYNVKVYNTLDKLVYRLSVNVSTGSTQWNIKANIIETDDEYNTINENIIPGYYSIHDGVIGDNGILYSESIGCAYLVSKLFSSIYSDGLTQLTISQKGDILIDNGNVGDWKALGIYGESVALNLTLLRDPENLGNGWRIEPDDFGEKIEKQSIKGVSTGKIEKGALIVKTSRDGVNWVYVNDTDNKYTDGVFTTNYAEYYKKGQNIQIYTPSGEDLINGVYLDVSFAYKVRNDNTKEEKNYIEEYKFYLCNNNLDGVTIHNLSVAGTLKEKFGIEDEMLLDIYEYAENMETGSGTVTGFAIQREKVPSAEIRVLKDGILTQWQDKYCDDGKYNISITSPMGKKREVVIYVDKSSKEKILDEYFGNYNLYMKRLYYEDSTYPVYESGVSFFRLKAGLSSTKMAIKISVKRDGEIIKEYGYTRKLTDIAIDKEGEYELTFTIASEIGNENSGDVRVIIFRFFAKKQGTAPGPQVNYNNLYNIYGKQSFKDYLPIYYGVTSDSGKGQITVVFATEEAALRYARSVEHGLVEEIEKGYFRYNGSCSVKKKEIYTDGWDLAKAEEEFAKQKVQKLYFDFSTPSSFYTLKEENLPKYNETTFIPDNIPYLEKSVYIFYDDEQRMLLFDRKDLPLVNDKTTYYIIPGQKNPEEVCDSFIFRNKNDGIDSNKVYVTDANGIKFDIEYDKSLEQQLNEGNCSSGIITIHEETKSKMGTGPGSWKADEREYKALYIAPGDIRSVVGLETIYTGGIINNINIDNNTVDASKGKEMYEIHADRVVINSFTDTLDAHSLIIVQGKNEDSKLENIDFSLANNKDFCVELEIPDTYYVKCVNRAGYSFEFKIIIDDSPIADTLDITLKDSRFNEITSENRTLKLPYGSDTSSLPSLSHYGYDFIGYYNIYDNTIYKNTEIEKISSEGRLVLEALWMAKKVKVSFVSEDGSVIEEVEVDYDSKIPFPDYDFSKDGHKLIAWQINNEICKSEEVLVNVEDELVYVALVDDLQSPLPTPTLTPTPTLALTPTPTPTPTPGISCSSCENSSMAGGIIVLVVGIIACGIIFIKRRKKNE